MRRVSTRCSRTSAGVAAAIVLALAACSTPEQGVPRAEESARAAPSSALPSSWTDAQRAEAYARFASFAQPVGAALGRTAMISGTTGAPAIAAGREVLRAGGSAVDAVLTTALGQVALAGQSWVSYAGILTLVVFDPATGAVASLDAAYAIPREETEPLSIPLAGSGDSTGRMVLVPGFLAGVEAAHRRFGRIPVAQLFAPAIEFAEQGFPVTDALAALTARAREQLARSPGTSALLLKPDGSTYSVGETFRQPELAATLRAIAAHGADWVTSGPWAAHLVELVRAQGGKLTLDDLAAHRPAWTEAVRSDYHGFEVCAVGAPGLGGVSLVEALNVLTAADLRALADPAERLFWWIQVTHLQATSFLGPLQRAFVFHGPVSDERRTTHEWAAELWERMSEGELALTRPLVAGTHSDAVVAVDARGQVAALVHSSNTGTYWATGIVVDGISIPDSAASQQELIANAGAGACLPDPTDPAIVLRDGKPVLASSSIGAGLHAHTLQRLVAVLDDELDPAAALARPALHLSEWDENGATTARVSAGAFDRELLERVRVLGQPIRELDARAEREAMGYWIGIRIDPASGALAGACPALLNGAVFGD